MRIHNTANMSNSAVHTTLLHLRDSEDHGDQKLIKYADFHNLYESPVIIGISEM